MKALTGIDHKPLSIALLMILNMLAASLQESGSQSLATAASVAGHSYLPSFRGHSWLCVMPSHLLAVPAALCAEEVGRSPTRWLGVAKKKRPIMFGSDCITPMGRASFRDPRFGKNVQQFGFLGSRGHDFVRSSESE